MYKIIQKEVLSENIFSITIHAPRVAGKCLPGQFVIVRADEKGERIPLTICDYNRENGTVTLVVQIVGASTLKLSRLNENDGVEDIVGPLGVPSEIVTADDEFLKNKNIVFVAGGVGTAPVYPQVKYLSERGYKFDVIIGAKSKNIVILEDEMKRYAKNVYVCTDDGSYGFKGLVTDKLSELTESGEKYDICVAIGPVVMMKFVSKLTEKLGIEQIVSMNPVMVDGTGMCGACRLTVGNEVKFACVDGPEFDGHKVDFDECMKRMTLYKTEEGRAFLKEKEGGSHHGGCGFCGGEN
ncbi:MAG: sulfide/dihydroorotate dehydrogenase-like FAD/NAD-binding protein [Clostridia bacterium]|nr:sulfide/dihydroorotate dehydrogenase-like FAD/NAD-binding protein [Clostridia bacterium]